MWSSEVISSSTPIRHVGLVRLHSTVERTSDPRARLDNTEKRQLGGRAPGSASGSVRSSTASGLVRVAPKRDLPPAPAPGGLVRSKLLVVPRRAHALRI